jgi:hypothetical protein
MGMNHTETRKGIPPYDGVTKSFRTGRLEQELQMVQLSATRCIEFCRHNPLCCFSTSVYCCKRIFRYRLSPETFGNSLIRLSLLCVMAKHGKRVDSSTSLRGVRAQKTATSMQIVVASYSTVLAVNTSAKVKLCLIRKGNISQDADTISGEVSKPMATMYSFSFVRCFNIIQIF